jgi:hypothetical protein
MEGQMIGTSFTPYIYSIILIIFGVIYSMRTKLWHTALFTFWMALTISVYFLAARPGRSFDSFELIGITPGPESMLWIETYLEMPVWFGFLAIMTLFFITLGPRIVKSIEFESNAIKLFKLSARQVVGEQNGYTDRPFTAGSHTFSRDEISGFASFLESKKICLPQYQDAGLKLLFSMGISPLSKKSNNSISYVLFGEDGNLSVFISKNDYQQYRKQYTFDQLCERLGNIFLRFAEYYKNHNEKRIIAELKSV